MGLQAGHPARGSSRWLLGSGRVLKVQGLGLSNDCRAQFHGVNTAGGAVPVWAIFGPSAWGIPPQAPEAWQETVSWAPEAAPGQASPQEQRQHKAKHHCQQEGLVVFRLHGATVHTATKPSLVAEGRSPPRSTVAVLVTVANPTAMAGCQALLQLPEGSISAAPVLAHLGAVCTLGS